MKTIEREFEDFNDALRQARVWAVTIHERYVPISQCYVSIIGKDSSCHRYTQEPYSPSSEIKPFYEFEGELVLDESLKKMRRKQWPFTIGTVSFLEEYKLQEAIEKETDWTHYPRNYEIWVEEIVGKYRSTFRKIIDDHLRPFLDLEGYQ